MRILFAVIPVTAVGVRPRKGAPHGFRVKGKVKMKRGFAATALVGPLLMIASPAAAQVRTVVEPVDESATEADVFFLNESAEPMQVEPPESVESARRGTGRPVTMRRTDGRAVTVPAGGFVRLRYAVDPPTQLAAAPMPEPVEGPGAGDGSASGSFPDRFEPHEPVYIIAGEGPEATKVQFSFAFRLFEGGPFEGLRFAHTQTMFWATERASWPVTATTYSPRLYYRLPLRRGERPIDLAVGYAHDSNGGGGRGSRDVNRLFARLSTRQPLGGDWSLQAAASVWTFIDWPAPTIAGLEDYWGHSRLELALEQDEGVKVSGIFRGIETGRGSAELNLSYPLWAPHGGLPRLYGFGQLFTGHGETLLRHTEERTRLRIGVAFVR